MRSLFILFILVLSASPLTAQTNMSFTFPGYRLAVAGPIVGSASGGLVAGKLDSLPRDRKAARFGVLFGAAGATVLELQDAASGKTLATVTVEQWSGAESSSWKRIPSLSSATAERVVEAFAIQQGKTSATIVRTVERIAAPHLPMGVGFRWTVGVANASTPSVRIIFRGILDGTTRHQGQLVTVASAEKQVPVNASMILIWTSGSSIRVDQNAKPRTLTVQSGPISSSATEPVTALDVTIAGTTSPVEEHQSAQASALLGVLQGQTARPLLVARTLVDRPKASPGDTVAYELTYYNVGTAPATEVELSNPVPGGTRLLEGSSSGPDSEITEEREQVAPPAVGRIQSVNWKFNGAISPGTSRRASFKVIVQ